MKVLFLSAWYPTKHDAMAGLFVQKHAEAVMQQGHDVRVLFSEKTGISWVMDMYKAWKELTKTWGRPDIVQMNVLDKNGLIALHLKHHYNIPYIIIEHWSGYLPANFAFRGGWHGWIMRKIAKNAACILPVSQMLEDAMKDCGIENKHWQRIHNVVDDFFYQSISEITIPAKPKDKFRLLHVSCFDEKAKNIKGLLRAVKKVAETRLDFELVLVGTGIDYQEIFEYADSLHFPKGMILFTGEQTPYQVAQLMQQSDCFVLFSHYETFAIVLAEAIASSTPIISTDTAGIASELPKECGITIPRNDEQALCNAIVFLMNNKEQYLSKTIKSFGEQYTYAIVGKQLSCLYQRIIIATNQ